jgi:hypothetical protein
LAPALGFALTFVAVCPDASADDGEADDDGAGSDGAGDGDGDGDEDNGEGDADEGRADGDDNGLRGRTGPFPLLLGAVPLEFNAVSPLWRHHQLPAP